MTVTDSNDRWNMNDQEIIKRREELRERHKQNKLEWETYDKRFPVIPGAYKPPDY